MITFLKMVAAFIVALIVLVIGVVVFVRWKVNGLLNKLMVAATAK
jgi:hypothetical protein